jgi:hypothetical protein
MNEMKALKSMEIPTDVLLHILEFLTPNDFFNVLLANKNFTVIANNEYLW